VIVESLRRVCRGLDKLKYELETVGDVDEAIRVVRTLESDMAFLSEHMAPADETRGQWLQGRHGTSQPLANESSPARHTLLSARLAVICALVFFAGVAFVLMLQYGASIATIFLSESNLAPSTAIL
jgi:hypothetical protein